LTSLKDLSLQKDEGKVAEPLGVVAAAVYLIFIFAFIPFPFYHWIYESAAYVQSEK
jgi:hypothetical protein